MEVLIFYAPLNIGRFKLLLPFIYFYFLSLPQKVTNGTSRIEDRETLGKIKAQLNAGSRAHLFCRARPRIEIGLLEWSLCVFYSIYSWNK